MTVNPSKPLLDKTMLVVCSPKKIADLVAGLEDLGGKIIPVPVLEVKEIDDKSALDEALLSLGKYTWIIFTSAYGVAFFARRLAELEIPPGREHGPKICAVGPATARAVEEFGFDAPLVAEKYVAEGVLEALAGYHGGLPQLRGHRILLPRALEAREVLPDALVEAGAHVDVVPCYQTFRAEMDETTIRRLREAEPDLIVFTSSSTIKNLMAILGQEYGKKLLLNSKTAVLGPITAGTAESFGKQAEIMPEENTVASLIDAIRKYYERGT